MSGADPQIPPGWPAISVAEAQARLGAPGARTEVVTVEVQGVPTRVWKNQPATIADVLDQAARYGERTFLVYEDERIGYGAFLRAVAALAHEFTTHGVGPGDRVAILMRNLPEWAVAFYAAAAAGAIATPLNAWWTASELAYGLADSGAKAVVADAERYARIADARGACPALQRVYVARSAEVEGDGVVRLEAVLGESRAWGRLAGRPWPETPRAGPDDPATLFYTSGTAGRPKGVLSSHRAFNCNIFTLMAMNHRPLLRRGETPPQPDPNAPPRATLLSVPLFHVAGCQAALNCTLFAGGKLVMMPKWDATRALELIARERIQQVGGVTTIAWQIVEHPARQDHDLSSIDMVNYGGAPCPPELLRRLREAFPQAQARQSWGMTETNGTVASNNGEDYLLRPDSCGVAAPIAELQIRDPEDGRTVLPTGAVGELWCKGAMCATAYWNDPQASAETFVDGWVRTGDLARLDAEGFCYIVDRAKDVVIRGGENIACIEVENVLYTHPAVAEAAVVGAPHPTLGEEPVAVVVLREGASVTEAQLRAHVAERLAAFKAPARVRVWPGALPRNAAGKVLKADLRQLFADAPTAA